MSNAAMSKQRHPPGTSLWVNWAEIFCSRKYRRRVQIWCLYTLDPGTSDGSQSGREKNYWESSKFFPLAKKRINVGIISPKQMMTPKHPILFPRNVFMSLHFQDNSSWVPHALMSLRLLVAAVMELTVEEKTTMPRTKTSRKLFRSPQGFQYPGNFH